MTQKNYTVAVLLILLLNCPLFPATVHGQAIVGNVYITIADGAEVFSMDANGQKGGTRFRVPINTKFSISGFDSNNNLIISFWRYKAPDAERKTTGAPALLTRTNVQSYPADTLLIGRWANYKLFIMDLKTFNQSCKSFFGKRNDFNWGVMTLPIKVRFGDGENNYPDFEENLNLGFTFGWRHQFQGKVEHASNVLGGFGIARVRADSISVRSGFEAPSSNTATAVMINAGFLYQHEAFQVGIFLGMDFIPGKLGRYWRHQGAPWIGLAVGVSLFSRNTTQGGTGENK
jgi:hypothetical protein